MGDWRSRKSIARAAYRRLTPAALRALEDHITREMRFVLEHVAWSDDLEIRRWWMRYQVRLALEDPATREAFNVGDKHRRRTTEAQGQGAA